MWEISSLNIDCLILLRQTEAPSLKMLGVGWAAYAHALAFTAFHLVRMHQPDTPDLEEYLRKFTTYPQDDWLDKLPAAESAINNGASSGIGGATPFFADLGRHPRMDLL